MIHQRKPSGNIFAAPRLKRQAFHDLMNQGPEVVPVGRHSALNAVHRAPIVRLEAAPQGVGQHLLGQRPRELGQLLDSRRARISAGVVNRCPFGNVPLASTGNLPSASRHRPIAS